MQERIAGQVLEQAGQPAGPGSHVAQVRAYHRLSMHRPDASAPGPGALDWSNQPDPVRRHAGCRQIALWQRPLGESPARAPLHPKTLAPTGCGRFLPTPLTPSASAASGSRGR